MKQKDIAILIAVVGVSAIFAFIIANQFLVPAKAKKLTAETVTPITAQFDIPDKTVFNDDAFNPTKLIEIEPNNNNQPFAK